jgi:hypothetical protein
MSGFEVVNGFFPRRRLYRQREVSDWDGTTIMPVGFELRLVWIAGLTLCNVNHLVGYCNIVFSHQQLQICPRTMFLESGGFLSTIRQYLPPDKFEALLKSTECWTIHIVAKDDVYERVKDFSAGDGSRDRPFASDQHQSR